MLKTFNILTLFLFVCFLFAPTVSYALGKDINTYSLILNEEEETHSKTKNKANNNINEEEEKEVQYHFFNNFNKLLSNNSLILLSLIYLNDSIKDDLVFKIPLPPPEQKL